MPPNDSWSDPLSESPTPMKKTGMSGCMLAGLIVGGLGLVGILLCCGGFMWFGSTMLPKIAKGPAEITAVGQEILKIEMPPDFSPDEAMTIDNVIYILRIAEFKQKEGKGAIMVGMVKIKIGDPSQADMQTRQFRDPIENKLRVNLDVQKTVNHEIMIDGQKVSVSIGEATDRASGKAVHLVSATIDLPSGKRFIVLRMDDDIWDEDAAIKMLEDAKAP